MDANFSTVHPGPARGCSRLGAAWGVPRRGARCCGPASRARGAGERARAGGARAAVWNRLTMSSLCRSGKVAFRWQWPSVFCHACARRGSRWGWRRDSTTGRPPLKGRAAPGRHAPACARRACRGKTHETPPGSHSPPAQPAAARRRRGGAGGQGPGRRRLALPKPGGGGQVARAGGRLHSIGG